MKVLFSEGYPTPRTLLFLEQIPNGDERAWGERAMAQTSPAPTLGGLLTSFSISARDLMVIPKRSKGCI